MNKNLEYTPKMIFSETEIKYYLVNNLQETEVTELVFLQFFGVHKKIKDKNETHYFIHYEDNKYNLYIRVEKENYYKFNSFKSINARQENQFLRYRILHRNNRILDYNDLADTIVDSKSIDNDRKMIDRIFLEDMTRKMYLAIQSLPSIQKRRVILYYLKGYKYREIALLDNCSISSVQRSVQRGIQTMRNIINLDRE